MAVGIQPSKSSFDQFLTTLAQTELRALKQVGDGVQQVASFTDEQLAFYGYNAEDIALIRKFVANTILAVGVLTGQATLTEPRDLVPEAAIIAGIIS